jgi:lipopolysaccharide biosynthesis regulator YciM
VLLLLLLATTVIISIFAAVGWNKARDTQRRLTTVEAEQNAERLGKQIADVTTCFNQAKNRPRLTLILRGIAVELEADPRQALNELIDDYEASTPATTDCIALARKNHIDPGPYLKHPPSEAGNGEK